MGVSERACGPAGLELGAGSGTQARCGKAKAQCLGAEGLTYPAWGTHFACELNAGPHLNRLATAPALPGVVLQ